jgi:hypothetical protein
MSFQPGAFQPNAFQIAIPAPVPNYDLLGAIDRLFPGVVVQRNLVDAANNRLLVKGAALDSSDVAAILAAANALDAGQALPAYVPTTEPDYSTTLPTYPAGLPRFPDAYGGMTSPDGWSRTWAGKVVEK